MPISSLKMIGAITSCGNHFDEFEESNSYGKRSSE